MLSHQNLVAEIFIPAAQTKEWMMKNAPDEPPIELRTLAHLPVAHIAGVLGYLTSPSWSGCAVYWMRKFEWKSFLEYNRKFKITLLYTVPSIFLRIAKSPDVTDQFKTLAVAVTGAAVMDEELQKAANAKLGTGQTYIGQTWGLSETTGAVTTMPKGEMDDTGSISPIMPNMEMR
jgi:4-coumarate--CoA ligase